LLDQRVGELAGLATSALWVVSSLSFTAAVRHIGATRLNLLRTAAAAVILTSLHVLATGSMLPWGRADAPVWLVASGIVGLTIGDQFLFSAYVHMGPRFVALLMTLAPSMAAAIAFVGFDQGMGPMGVLGMLITTAGVAWVALGRGGAGAHVSAQSLRRGLWLGLGAAACQAIGVVLSKQGLDRGLTPLGALVWRMDAAAITLLPLGLWAMWRGGPRPAGALRQAMPPMALGVLTGPLLGVYCSMVATERLPVGVAATLTQLVPVFILPVSRILHREPISTRALTGAIIAVAGVAVLACDAPAPQGTP
jgi:drug/metabolite transporter (DMT)-like permease